MNLAPQMTCPMWSRKLYNSVPLGIVPLGIVPARCGGINFSSGTWELGWVLAIQVGVYEVSRTVQKRLHFPGKDAGRAKATH